MPDTQPAPDGYATITPYLVVTDAQAYLDFLANAFDAVERMRMEMPDGEIGHAEVEIGNSVVMVSDATPPEFPPTIAQMHVYVDDVDSTYVVAVKAGAAAVADPEDQPYGDRIARIVDPSGNRWSIATHIEDVDMDELARQMAEGEEG